MKKILIATTALVATAGVAAADVAFSGYGRFGVLYDGSAVDNAAKTTVETRFRFNIDVSETDSGVTFGGRVRMQYDDGSSNTAVTAANMYAAYNGLKVTVGNVDGAYDDAALIYNSEMGLTDTSFGDPAGAFYAYDSNGYSAAESGRMGINVTYAIAGFAIEASYINPDQYEDDLTSLNLGTVAAPIIVEREAEYALAVSYKYNQFTISAATAQNGAGIKDNDVYFIGAEYAVNDMANVGLLYLDNGDLFRADDNNTTVTLYGNYTMDALTLRGYVAHNSEDFLETQTSFGLGADYDLGGATLLGSIERGYDKEAYASMGVKFTF